MNVLVIEICMESMEKVLCGTDVMIILTLE